MTVDADILNSSSVIPLKKRDLVAMEAAAASPEPAHPAPAVIDAAKIDSLTSSPTSRASSGFMITDILSGRSQSPASVVSAASEEFRARFAAAAAVAAASRLGGNVPDLLAASKAAAAAAGHHHHNIDVVSGDESEEAESVSGRDNFDLGGETS